MNASYARDLELARQCAAGEEPAWERFVLEYRPLLYRAADAIDILHETGTLAPGKAADILVVDGDVATDIEALARTRAVLRDGQVVAGYRTVRTTDSHVPTR